MNTYLKDTLRNLRSGEISGAGLLAHVHRLTCRTARVVTDFFVACMCVTDFYTCCSLCGKPAMMDFSAPAFGDGFPHGARACL